MDNIRHKTQNVDIQKNTTQKTEQQNIQLILMWMNNTNINNFLLSDVYSVKYFYGIVVDKTTTNTFYNKLHQIAYY